MMTVRRTRPSSHVPAVLGLLLLGLAAGCSTSSARRPARVDLGEQAQPACQPADFLPGRQAAPAPSERCWNEANLATMVADPHDLLHGRPLGAASGAHEALAVEAYRKGQVKPLAGQDSTNAPAQPLSVVGATGP